MKRILCFLLVLTMLCPAALLSSCQKKQTQSTEPFSSPESVLPTETPSTGVSESESTPSGSSLSESAPSTEPTPESPTSPEEEIPDLPAHSTLMGTKHLPIPDNQGSIGSCTSEGITYTQFTVAVSQFINATDPDADWDPSSGDESCIFSPKFTYNYAGPSTENAYKVLMDHGCLPFKLSSFFKNEKPAGLPYQNPSVLNHDQSRSWDVRKGLMQKALKYRLTGFEENEFTATQAGQLTYDTDLTLFYKIKDALARGNSVTVCGWPMYFQYTKLTAAGKGAIGAEGESVVWTGMTYASGTAGSGNHCISIIGYDDTISVTVAGIELKGAFQIMDSYAIGPTDIYYVMYDAFNLVSEHQVLNTPEFYENTVALSLENMNFQTGINATGNQMLTFTPNGELLSHNGKDYPLYTISDAKKKLYLSFDGEKFTKGSEKTAKSFALIPYTDSTEEPEKDYKDGYLVAMVEGGKIKGYLAAEVNTNNATVRFHANTADMAKICYAFSHPVEKADGKTSFVSRIALSKDNGNGYVRKGTMYRFSFIYWDKHIQIGNPQLMVEAQISMVDRTNLYMTLTRTDQNGNTLEYAPASMDIRHNKNFLPELNINGPVSFSGKKNPTIAETGVFTFGYHVLDDFGSAASYDAFIWGINVRGNGAKVLKLRLLDQNGDELCAVTPDENNCAPALKETLSFEFRQSADLTSHFGKGVYSLYNVGAKKTLSLATNNMLFEWCKESNKASVERASFRVEYVAEKDCYVIRHGTKNYVFDIAESVAKEGVIVKMNAPSTQRNTQYWTVTAHKDGTLTIANKADPTLFFGYDGKNFCLGKDAENPGFRFVAKVTGESNHYLDLSFEGKTVTATAVVPKGYTAEELKLSIVKDGTVTDTLKGTVSDGVLTFNQSLAPGDYLFCLTKDGKAIGNMVACRIS